MEVETISMKPVKKTVAKKGKKSVVVEPEPIMEEVVEEPEIKMESVVSANGELIDPLKKRRGRKPKSKEVDDQEDNEEESVVDDEENGKKRGRKPKEKTYSITTGGVVETDEKSSETVILHLPIKKESEEKVEPTPYLKKHINYSMISSYSVSDLFDPVPSTAYQFTHSSAPTKKKDDTIMTMMDGKEEKQEDEEGVKNDYDANFSFLESEGKEEVLEEELIKKAEKEEKIVEVKSPIEYSAGGLMPEEECKTNRVLKKNLKHILYEFVNSNSANTWPESTNTCCWWCCHPFEGMPCALPEVYRRDKFFVCGVYCSFNCAASYNFSKNDGDDMWMRYSLLNLMYKKMYGTKFVKIGLAPPREVLKMFGGYMCIEEFRETSLRMDKTFQVIKPPMVAIIPKIEENILNRGIRTGHTNEHILSKTQNSLKLKRTKPVMNPNSTLQSFMNIKIV
jgi:hypothetical protein